MGIVSFFGEGSLDAMAAASTTIGVLPKTGPGVLL